MAKKATVAPKKEPVLTSAKPSISTTKTSPVSIIFQKENYYIMLAGIGILMLGFIIMALDKEPYGFGFLGLTLGPVVLIIGFAIQFWAIFFKPKKS